jgi:hypothetical protein
MAIDIGKLHATVGMNLIDRFPGDDVRLSDLDAEAGIAHARLQGRDHVVKFHPDDGDLISVTPSDNCGGACGD